MKFPIQKKNGETVRNKRSPTKLNYKRKGRNPNATKFKVNFIGEKREPILDENNFNKIIIRN